MSRIFSRNLSMVFSGFLACLLWGYEAEGRAPRFCPDTIKLSGSTFEAEKITVAEPPGGPKRIQYKQGAHKITFGNTVLSYREMKQSCWFHHNSKKCLSQEVADKSKGGGNYHVVIRKNGKEIGVVELDDKSGKLYAYSISAAGQKDPKKPYLEFHEVKLSSIKLQHHQVYKLTVNAYDGGRLVGKYESLSDDRNPGTEKPQNCPNSVLDLRGKQFLLKKGS